MKQTFDSIVIGTGQAGPALAVSLAKSGRKVGIIERHLFGGTCVNTGCIPTKTMVASARAAHMARRAADYGVIVDGAVSVDMRRVKARKEQVLMKSRTSVEEWLRGTENCAVIQGHARFTADHQVRVGEDTLEAAEIFINVGGRASAPISGLDQVPYLTNTSIMELDTLPQHLIVVGGSYIGLEFAQMFRRFGSRVTVVERAPKLIGREDPDISDAILKILEKEGIDVRLGADCIAVSPAGKEIEVRVNCTSGAPAVRGSHLLVAVGRVPNTSDLGLDTTAIRCDERGYIKVDEELRTSAAGVWALGDCNGRGAFTHTSWNDYEIVEANLLRGEKRRVSDRIQAYALYIDPPLGRCGMSESEVRRSGRPALMATREMTRVGRAVEKGETDGFMKILVDAETRKILGAAILGVEGDEAIHCILDVMYTGASWEVLRRAMHIHPTVCELIPTLLGDLKPLEASTPD